MTGVRTESRQGVVGGYSIDRICRAGDAHKARILFGRRDGVACVIKDLAPMRPLFRALYGRRMLAREARALEALSACSITPRLVERISADAIAVERIATKYKYLRSKIPAEVMPGVLRALDRAVEELHSRGFVHFDLRQRKNILVPNDRAVVLIDFESSRNLGRGWFGRRVLMPMLSGIDRAAVLKWKAKFAPEMLSTADRRRAERYAAWKRLWPWKRLGRWLRRQANAS
jgi:predicted Ser/Thr protein kinase